MTLAVILLYFSVQFIFALDRCYYYMYWNTREFIDILSTYYKIWFQNMP